MAKNLSVPMIGICRGLQFINVVHGGTLIQHLNEHGDGLHEVRAYDGTEHTVNSYHHQSVILPKNARATTVAYIQHPLSEEEDTIYQHDSEEKHFEVEAVFYGKTRSLGVQWHPEIPDHGGNSKSLFWNLFTLTDITIPD
jgi:putative glutamine amidotransferase